MFYKFGEFFFYSKFMHKNFKLMGAIFILWGLSEFTSYKLGTIVY